MAGTVQCLSPSQCISLPHLAMPGMWLMLGSDSGRWSFQVHHVQDLRQIGICFSSLNLPALCQTQGIAGHVQGHQDVRGRMETCML